MKLTVSIKLDHSHKKRKDTLETRADRAILRPYVENQAILEPILLYMHQNINKRNCRAIKTVCELLFYLAM